MRKATPRIVHIGPVLPYRGGIAQHTTRLRRALQEQTNALLTISFSRQYPSLFFPGETDRDPELGDHREPGVRYVIDSVNPLTWHRAVREICTFRADVVIIPWWTFYWAICFEYIARSLRSKGIRIVFFCHNTVEHEASSWKALLTRRVLRLGDAFVVHSQKDKMRLQKSFPGVSVTVHPHPIYDQFPPAVGHWPKRRDLDLLYYGFIRPYKGVGVLVEAMAQTHCEVFLTIAGEFWEGRQHIRRRIDDLGIGERIELRPHYHSQTETAELFARCDAVILPYLSASASGVVPVAYRYEKPVIVSRVGGLPDVVRNAETGWIVEPNNPVALADTMATIDRRQCAKMVPAIREFKKTLTWESLASAVLET